MPAKKTPSESREEKQREKAACDKIFQILFHLSHVDFSHYRQTTIRRRLKRAIALGKHKSYSGYCRFLERHPEEADTLCEQLLLSFTEFFREPKMFEALKRRVLPELEKQRPAKEPIRFWIPGCSTGEEVYSFAIAYAEFAEENGVKARAQFFGTDVVERNVERARSATYGESIRKRVSPERLERYFDLAPEGYRVVKQLREMCVFARQDITADPPLSNIDLVSCRNVLIYFDAEFQERVLPLFHFAMKPSGFLVLGASETTGRFPRLFGVFDKRQRIYTKRASRSKPCYPFVSYAASAKPKGPAATSPQAAQRGVAKADLGQLIERAILERCAPAGVLVDGAMNIRRYVGRTGQYLEASSGEASLKLTHMVREGLMPDIYLAIEDVKRLGGPSPRKCITHRVGRSERSVEIFAIPIADPSHDETLFLVLFDEVFAPPARRRGPKAITASDRATDAENSRLKGELQETKQHLQHIIEEKEEVNQELWAANEEVQSTNEELQSINEEMEAAKEELESSNEELITLNEELLEKNLELMQAKELTESIVNSSIDGIVAFDAELRYTVWNPGMESISGQPNEKCLGRRSFEVFPGLDGSPEAVGMRAALGGEVSIARDRPFFVPQTGKRGFVEAHFSPLRDAAGDVVGGLGVIRDTTERKLALDALTEAESRFRTLFEKSQDAYLLLVGGVFTNCNEAAQELYGARREALIGRGPYDFSPEFQPSGESSLREALERIAEAEATGASKFEWLHERADGTAFWAEVTLTSLVIGGERAAFASVRDITVRKRAQEALIASEQRLRAIVENANEVIYTLTWDGVFTFVSPAWTSIIGHPVPDVVGKSFVPFVHPDDVQACAEFLARVRETGRPQRGVEYRVKTTDGQWVWFTSTGAAIRDGAESPGYYVGVGLEITERKRSEEVLRENEERYRKLIDASPQGIFIVDAANRTGRYANPQFLRLFGCPAAQVERLRADDLHPPDEVPSVLEHFAAILRGEETLAPALKCRRSDGSIFYADISAVPLELGGEPCVVGMFADVTERKLAEERRMEMERRLMHAQKLESLGVLAGGIAHDFNNLLTAILGNLDLALREPLPASSTRSMLEQAIKATNSAADLTRQMLAYSGKGRFVLERLDLNEVVQSNAGLFRSSVARTASLEVSGEPGLPLIEADPAQIQQVIMNLVTNASEAVGARAGAIEIRTGTETCDEARLGDSLLEEKPLPGQFAFVEVADSGEGMDAEALRRLFEPFFTTKFTGRGLGMSVVSGIVRGHKGAIFVDSEPGRGTVVRVLFPASTSTAPPQPERSVARPVAETPRDVTILVVDDEEIVRKLSVAFAERMGFRTIAAADGEEALDLFRQHASEIDCVILDLTMPRMDGVRTFREMKRIAEDVPVILSSGYSEQHATSLFDGEGLAGFLEKPFRLSAFEEKLRSVLKRRS
jgi:PAS domain S-box-containing protein